MSGVRAGLISARDELAIVGDEELVERARRGDDRAIEVLLDRYRHYARAKARIYFLAGADHDDIVQEGMIGLYKAIRDFQSDKNIAFRVFAELCMKRQIITAIKASNRQKHQPLNAYVSLDKPPSADHEANDHLLETASRDKSDDPADLVVSAEEIEAIKDSVGRLLSTFEADVLALYMDGHSYQQIAAALGRHGKSIDNALQRIKRKLEHHLPSA